MLGGGGFDFYCTVCGLPFREIENARATSWLENAVLTFKHYAIKLHSQGDHGAFDVVDANTPIEILNMFKKHDAYSTDKKGVTTWYIFDVLENQHGTACIHEDCHHRQDAQKVANDLVRVQQYQEQYFNDEAFLSDAKLHYLLIKPSKASKASKDSGNAKASKASKASKDKTVKANKTVKTLKPKEQKMDAIVPFTKFTVKQLSDVCDILKVKKGSAKSNTIANIRTFVCQ